MLKKLEKISYYDSHYASSPGAIINPHWLELPLFRTNFHGPKGVQAIEVLLYIKKNSLDNIPTFIFNSFYQKLLISHNKFSETKIYFEISVVLNEFRPRDIKTITLTVQLVFADLFSTKTKVIMSSKKKKRYCHQKNMNWLKP